MALDSLKLLGVLSLSEVHKWRNLLGDIRFSQVLGYLSNRIIEEDVFYQKNMYGVSPTRDIKLIIEYLLDLTPKNKKSAKVQKVLITDEEFESLSESLIDSSMHGSLTNIINFSDLREFLMIKKFGYLPQHLLYRTLLFRTLSNVSEKCNCILIEFLNNQVKFNVLEEPLFLIDNIEGHAIDLIDNSSADAVLFDNNSTRLIETEKQKILNPMVNFCFNSNKSLSGLLNNPETTELSSEIEHYYQLQGAGNAKNWKLPRRDTELLFYLLHPGEFTKIFRNEFQGIEREFLYFSPFDHHNIWRINTYHKNSTAKYSILTNAIQNIALIPIANKITGILSNSIQNYDFHAYNHALLKNNMRELILGIKSRRYDVLKKSGPINIIPNINDSDIKTELINKEIEKEMLTSNEIIRNHISTANSKK
ncbi:MAG: hypothetical protein ACTSRG_13610 [Candidatus Helarchaeota archaeon]